MPKQRQDTQGTSGEPKICVLLAWRVAAISAEVDVRDFPRFNLNPRKSFLMTEHWVEIYPNQKEINYISLSIL